MAWNTAFGPLLVVESDPPTLEVYVEILKTYNIEAFAADSGVQALDILSRTESKPKAILTNIKMPIMNGFELLAAIRAKSEYADVPVIAITGYAYPEDKAFILSQGFNEYLAKPIRIRSFMETIVTSILNIYRKERQIKADRHSFEQKYLHPVAADYLLGLGCSYEHEVKLHDSKTGQRGRIDFIAYHPDGSSILIDCKKSNHDFSGALEQIQRYRDLYIAQYQLGAAENIRMMLIIPTIYWTTFHYDWAKAQKIDLVAVYLAVSPTTTSTYQRKAK